MHKIKKSRVSRDFDDTLQRFIRSLSKEELNILDAFETPEERNDFVLSFPEGRLSNSTSDRTPERRVSVYQNRSYKKYELVVDTNVESTGNNENIDNTVVETKIFTRPILKHKPLSELKKSQKSISSKYFQRFFPSFNHLNIPFERTTLTSLPFHLQVELDNQSTISIQVTEFYAVNVVKSKIFKKKGIAMDHQALFYKNERLESSALLYSYGIQSNSSIQLRLCPPVMVQGHFQSTVLPLSTYTSVTVRRIKAAFAKELTIDLVYLEMKYNGQILDDDKELFVYNISDGSKIDVVEIKERPSDTSSLGHLTVNRFLNMTDNITKCKCNELRIGTIADILQLMFDGSTSGEQLKRNQEFLLEFDSKRNFHHSSCFKIASSPNSPKSDSQFSSISDMISTSFSGSDNSLKSAMCAESLRVARHDSLKIDDQYIRLIAQCEDFKVFKHLLKDKVGKKCNLRSVALLYQYTRKTVRYIGIIENETCPDVDRILEFAKLYFKKYFQKEIVKQGGLGALTLSGSDID